MTFKEIVKGELKPIFIGFALVLAAMIIYFNIDGAKVPNTTNADIIAACRKVADKFAGDEIAQSDVNTVPAGSGGRYGYSQTLVYWKDENLKIDVSCLAHKRAKSDIRIVQFKVDGEDITDLVRREERK